VKNKLNISDEKAQKIAVFVMDAFGYESRIIDNILRPDERQLFYMLEAEGFLVTGRERTRLHDGREWMTHYWELRQNQIHLYAKNTVRMKIKDTIKSRTVHISKPTIYSSLSEDLWLSRKILNQ